MRRWILLFALATTFIGAFPARASDSIPVYLAGDSSAIRPALELAGPGAFTFVSDPRQANAIVLNGEISNPELIAALRKSGAGIVLILGPEIRSDAVSTVLGFPISLEYADTPTSLAALPEARDPLIEKISWNDAPQVRERERILTPISSVQPIIDSYEDGGWLIWQSNDRRSFIVDFYLSGDANPQIREWAYFNYLLYHLTVRAAGRTPLDFADYPGSPVPHQSDQIVLIGILVLLLITSFGAFFFVRRYSKRHPEELEKIVIRPIAETGSKEDGWEEVGFRRPLSGFLVALAFGLILFIPLILYQNLILPTYILPSAQAIGIWGRVTQFFNVAWYFFDMGTSVAFVKYLSEFRVHDPKRGIQYGQLFVWWQLLSGSIQVALVIALASTVAPRSIYALYAWSMIIHATIQLPGFYQVLRHALSGFQRHDAARFLDVCVNVIMPVIMQPVFVLLFFAWGKAHPQFGGAMGGLLGMGIAAYAGELATFLIGIAFYRRMRFNLRVLFLAHFDWNIIRTGFRFGVFEMLGAAIWSGGQAAEIWVTQTRLINYTEIWGNWMLAQNFVFAFQVIQMLNEGVMPAISEAIANGKRILSQYYSAMTYKWSGMISAFIGAVLLAVAPSFLLGSTGAEFHRAAIYVIPLAVWGAIQYFSWVGDTVELGSNRPYLKSILIFGEQTTRIALMYLLLKAFQVNALIIAYFIGLLAKGVAAYFVNHKICFPQKFFVYSSLTAPLLAAFLHFLILQALGTAIWKGDAITSVIFFFLAILPSFPVYLFLYALVGGWDTATLEELQAAVGLTGAMKPIVWLIWAASALGARISPLHDKFPIHIRPAAIDEARMLTLQKVRI